MGCVCSALALLRLDLTCPGVAAWHQLAGRLSCGRSRLLDYSMPPAVRRVTRAMHAPRDPRVGRDAPTRAAMTFMMAMILTPNGQASVMTCASYEPEHEKASELCTCFQHGLVYR